MNIIRLKKEGFWSGKTFRELEESLGEKGSAKSVVIPTNEELDPKAQLAYPVGTKFNYFTSESSIACVTGTQITPDGIFNIASAQTTPLTPNGYIAFPINQDTSDFFLYADTYGNARQNLAPYSIESLSNPQQSSLQGLTNDQCYDAICELSSEALKNNFYINTFKLDPKVITKDGIKFLDLSKDSNKDSQTYFDYAILMFSRKDGFTPAIKAHYNGEKYSNNKLLQKICEAINHYIKKNYPSERPFTIEDVYLAIRKELNDCNDENLKDRISRFEKILTDESIVPSNKNCGKVNFEKDGVSFSLKTKQIDEQTLKNKSRFLIGEFRRYLIDNLDHRKNIIMLVTMGASLTSTPSFDQNSLALAREIVELSRKKVFSDEESVKNLMITTLLVLLDPFSPDIDGYLSGEDFKLTLGSLNRILNPTLINQLSAFEV